MKIAFTLISIHAKIHAYSDNAELSHALFNMGCKDESISALMDAVAALYIVRWQKDNKDAYQLVPSVREFDIFRPDGPYQKERHEGGIQFINAINQMPLQQRQAILSDQRLPFAALPVNVAASIKRMLNAFNAERAFSGRRAGISADDLGRCFVQANVRHLGRFDDYWVTVIHPTWGSMGWSFNDYSEREETIDAMQRSRDHEAIYTPVKFEVSQNEAKRLPALQRLVRIRAKNVTFPVVLSGMTESYGIAFISNTIKEMPQRADLDLGPMPLGEMLDKLTEIYLDSEWEYRKAGFIIIRGHSNPARDPNQGKRKGTTLLPFGPSR